MSPPLRRAGLAPGPGPDAAEAAQLSAALQATLEDLVSAMACLQRTVTALHRRVDQLERVPCGRGSPAG